MTSRRYHLVLACPVDGTGTRRRFRALVALGWPVADLAARLEMPPDWFTTYRDVAGPVESDVREAMCRLYDELCWTVPPPSPARAAARRLADERRWAPPLAWDDDDIDEPSGRANRGHGHQPAGQRIVDEVAVERAMRGERIRLYPAERQEAVRRLTARGLSTGQIARLLHLTPRSITARRRAESSSCSALDSVAI